MILQVPVNRVADALDDLKYKVLSDFDKYLKKLSYGYSPEYKDILNEICLIESFCDIDKNQILCEFYLHKL